jgi:hypothetical protein
MDGFRLFPSISNVFILLVALVALGRERCEEVDVIGKKKIFCYLVDENRIIIIGNPSSLSSTRVSSQ